MNPSQHPLLDALKGRGPSAYAGEPLSFLLIEVQEDQLQITGATPLRHNGDRYTQGGQEYRYILKEEEAEKLLSALSRHPGDRPERVIAQEFEFSWPDRPLKDYLDTLHLSYQYDCTDT